MTHPLKHRRASEPELSTATDSRRNDSSGGGNDASDRLIEPSGRWNDTGDPTIDALSASNPQRRLQAAMAIGTRAEPRDLDVLIARCRVEPDFFVRDMLTWALTRLPADVTVGPLIAELDSTLPQAISQSLHTLSKIGGVRAWPPMDPARIGTALIAHSDAEAARSAWRAAVALVPGESREELASALVTQLGRGGVEMQKSLSRAFVALGDDLVSVVDEKLHAEDDTVRAHAMATRDMFDDPDAGFAHALDAAKRVVALGSEATVQIGTGKV